MERTVNKKAFGQRVMAARLALGMSQEDLAKKVGMKQQGIGSIEKGDVERPRKLREISQAINKSEEFLLYGVEPEETLKVPENGLNGTAKSTVKTYIKDESLVAPNERSDKMPPYNQQNVPGATPSAHLFGERDLPVYGTAQGGEGSILLTNEPVDWVLRPDSLLRVKDGYAVIVTGDSMSPEHKSGSTALVNPHLPARTGDACIFQSHDDHGAVKVCIKEFVSQTDDVWHVRQHNPPKKLTLKKSEWQVCHVTVGNYFRR